MLIPMIASCGEKKEGKVAASKPKGSAVGEDVTFLNDTFTVLCREDTSYGKYEYEITADEGSTDIVNQAVYQRNRDACDMFGLAEINALAVPGDWRSKDTFINKFRNSIDAGLGDYDLIMGYQAYMAQGELAQYFYNFNDVPFVNESLDKEYYYKDFINEMTIDGQLKYMVGDYSLSYYDHAYVMYFNKSMAEEYALEDIYSLVKEGKWTIDKCMEMAKGKWKDNNNNNWSLEDTADTFGYISDLPNTADALHSHFDIQPTNKSEGVITFDIDVGKMTSILEKMVAFKESDDTFFFYSTSDMPLDQVPLDTIFKEGRALFYPATLEKAENFRSMDIDFGIIPYPKWNETQEGYYTQAQDGYSVACVPSDAKNLKKSGAVFDVLTQLSYENVVPAYYDQALKYKLTRDDASAEMLDIIRSGFKINFGSFYTQSLGCAIHIRELIKNNNTSYASFHESKVPAYQTNLESLMKDFNGSK